ncbi:MAG TPA: hypothetical protein VNJ47_00985 [Nevskiales bacterium]|nr:hypothetical protein [Nevskiales bacterium]
MSRRLSMRQIWTAPAALAVVSVVGLLAALLADGWGDMLSWAALSIPVLVGSGYALARKQKSRP